MSAGANGTGGNGKLKSCPAGCPCICHVQIGNVTEHSDGFCYGKLLTNTPERIANWKQKKSERNLKTPSFSGTGKAQK